MVAQYLDHPAVCDPPARALQDHAFEFRLKRHQAGKAALDLGQLGPSDGIGGGAELVGIV